MHISWDAQRPTYVESHEIDSKTGEVKKAQETEIVLVNPDDIPLYELTNGIFSARLTTPGSTPLEMLDKAKAALDDSTWFLHANCSTSYDRICSPETGVISAHTIIKLSGAGSRYDGLYAVSGVTHTIDKVSYKLQVELMRNGWNRPKQAAGPVAKQKTVKK